MPVWLHLKPEQVGKYREREIINLVVPFRSNPMRNRKVQKNSKNIQKIKKIPFWLYFKPKQCGKEREREKIDVIGLFRSYPTWNRKFQKNRKKN